MLGEAAHSTRERPRTGAKLVEAVTAPLGFFVLALLIVITNENAGQVWNRLAKHVDKNDYMLIIEVRDNVQGWLPKDAWEWIHANVPNP